MNTALNDKRSVYSMQGFHMHTRTVHFVFRAFSFPIFDTSRSNIRSTHVTQTGPFETASPRKWNPPPPLPLSLFHGKWPLSFLPSPVSKLSKFPFEKVCSGSRWDRTHPSLDHTPSPFLKHLSGNRSSSSLPKGISILFSFLEWKYWEDRNIPCWYLRIFIDRYRNRRGLLLSHSWYFGI